MLCTVIYCFYLKKMHNTLSYITKKNIFYNASEGLFYNCFQTILEEYNF